VCMCVCVCVCVGVCVCVFQLSCERTDEGRIIYITYLVFQEQRESVSRSMECSLN